MNKFTIALTTLLGVALVLLTSVCYGGSPQFENPRTTSIPFLKGQPITVRNANRIELLREIAVGEPIRGLAWSSDGGTLGISSFNEDGLRGALKLYNVVEGEFFASLPANAMDLEFSLEGSYIVAGKVIWGINSNSKTELVVPQPCSIYGVSFSPDGRLVATTEETCMGVRIWDAATGEQLWSLNGRDLGMIGGGGNLIYSVDFNTESTAVVFGYGAGAASGHRLYLWFFESDDTPILFEPPASPVVVDGMVTDVKFSPNNKLIASSGWDGSIRLWNVETHQQVVALSAQPSPLMTISFNSDGLVLASGGFSSSIQLWDIEKQHVLTSLLIPNGPTWTVEFNSTGTLLATGGEDGIVRLWGVQSANFD